MIRSPLKTFSIAVALVGIYVLLSGCTRVSTVTGERNAWTQPGVLRIAGRQEPDNLNPLLGTQVVDSDLASFWAGFLFLWNDHNELVPELAQEVPTRANGGISRDGLTITYHLRKNVKWQDGAPFGADDVVFTWHAIMSNRNAIASRVGMDPVATVQKRDDHTIVVRLKRKFAPILSAFFGPYTQRYCILPNHLLAKYPDLNRIPYNELPIGAGPFRVASYERGQRVVLVANPLYWRGRPRLNRIEFRIVPSDSTMLTLLETHAIDFYYKASEALFSPLHGIPGTRLVVTPSVRFTDVGFNASVSGLDDARVRRALAFAIDRQALVDKVAHGVAVVGHTDQPEFSWAYNPHAPSYSYDPARATALLDEAGWRFGADGLRAKNGRPLRLTLVSFTGSQTISSTEAVIQAEWARVGVDVSIKNYPSNQLYATNGVERAGKFDAILEQWQNGSDPDNSILYTCNMTPPNGWNVYHFCNRKVETAEAVALGEYERSKRKPAYSTIQNIVNDELPFSVLWYDRQIGVINSDLRNYRPAHASSTFWNTWQWEI